MTTPTREALAGLGTTTGAGEAPPTVGQRAVDGVTRWLQQHTGRRGFLVRAGLVGAAVAADPFGYVLKPGTAYASVCGPGASCTSGWTVFCATINSGVNACPPGSIAAGWWKADGAALCGGSARYIIDCNATCSRCSSAGSRAGICSTSCWSCSCRCGPSSSCDQRRTCCNAFRYGQCNTQVRQVGGVHCRVVSCTPPWRFERCTTSSATDDRTRDHNSDQLPSGYTALTRRYIAIGENRSVLGATVHAEFSVPGGRAQRYQHGRMSWSSATGAHEQIGSILSRYLAMGAEGSLLGFPTEAERPGRDGTGRYSTFQHGRISWYPGLGSHETYGAIGARYVQDGAQDGPLGYPTSGELDSAGGRAQRFQHGRLSWRSGPGAHATVGPIAQRYAELGAEGSRLGFPVAEQVTVGGVRSSDFEHGRISYNPTTRTVTVTYT